MRTFEAGKAVTLTVALTQQNGQPAVPDEGTAVLSVRAPDGTELRTETLTIGPADHLVTVTIEAIHNQITTPFSRRIVAVSGLCGGLPFETKVMYRLLPAILYTVQPEDVRRFIGINEGELPNEDVDLAAAMLALEFEVTRERLSTALVSGTQDELRANEAILYRTVLDIIPSLANRVALEESDGALTFRRHARTDFSELRRTAEARLSAALATINPSIDPGYSILITTADADPITG